MVGVLRKIEFIPDKSTEYSAFHGCELPVRYCVEDKKQGKVIGWKFKCPICKRMHYHSPEAGPRESHCTKSRQGYYLKLQVQSDN